MVLIDAKTLAERFPQASISSPKDQMLYENLKSDELRESFKKIERLVKVRDRSVLEVRNTVTGLSLMLLTQLLTERYPWGI